MINTQKVLDAMTSMQQNTQGALPAIPNNGNPAGAYNMPQQGTPQPAQQQQPQTQSPYYYPWLAPSEHMDSIRNQLTERQMRLSSMLEAYAPQPMAPQAPMPQQMMPQAPMMQQAPTQQPILQAPPVLPQQGMMPNPTVY